MATKRIPKTDITTICLHWALVVTLVFSLLTGFRIAVDKPDATLAPLLSGILLQGDVIQWHSWTALALGAVMIAYIIFLIRARLTNRVSVSAGQQHGSTSNKRHSRLKKINILIYWMAFILLFLAAITGLVLYIAPGLLPYWLITDTHQLLAWIIIAYVFLHVIAQLALGGVPQLLKILNPTAAYGAAAISAIAVAGAAAAGVYALDRNVIEDLPVTQTQTAPVIDGKGNDEAWAGAPAVTIATGRGVNSPAGEDVTVRMVHDDETLYTLFEWPDSTRSRKHLPLQKTEQGWQVLQSQYGINDENDYYEDKFGVMFATSSAIAGAGTSHLGPKPLANKPAPANGRGLHYTTDDSLVDVWHWKSVRTGAVGQIDDNYFGPPMEPNPEKDRYTGGYTQDPKTGGGYTSNWESFDTEFVTPKRLPKDPGLIEGLQSASLDPETSDEGQFWMAMDDTIPYSKEADTYPVGTIMPSVLHDGPTQGDRGQVHSAAKWHDGRWTLEAERKLDTGSKFDAALSQDTPLYMWVAVFDHTQTRHSQHLHPVRMIMR
ncbi:ethylbenzene dehydrogenase-related protein [Halomonas sp. M20]|uniref:ethylbenzene dehydrogenase-related protein n=1 Tax=Halomonas sp. M20 TaxID=2763264 RepID=UPI001D0AF40A|nr:ethylbenzene dehydrogenase-related protein [Halomonas sp. M20]